MDQSLDGKMDVYEFGRRLLETQDIDPVYVLVWEALRAGDFSPDLLNRYLLSYWCFYHVGTAAEIASAPDEDSYWLRMGLAAESKGNTAFPRSAERRHFRGKNAATSIAYLAKRGVNDLLNPLIGANLHVRDVAREVGKWTGFGPWIAFKVADMIERLGLSRVEFDINTVMYDSPREAAELLWRIEHPGEGRRSVRPNEGEWAVKRILECLASPETHERGVKRVYLQRPLSPLLREGELDPHDAAELAAFRGRLAGYAPPRYERPLGMQEAETILCKWKSYLGGKYHVGEDVTACRRGLIRFARCPLSQKLLKAGTKGGLW